MTGIDIWRFRDGISRPPPGALHLLAQQRLCMLHKRRSVPLCKAGQSSTYTGPRTKEVVNQAVLPPKTATVSSMFWLSDVR